MSAFMASTSGLIALSSDRKETARQDGAPLWGVYLERQYNPLKSSAGGFCGGGGADWAGRLGITGPTPCCS